MEGIIPSVRNNHSMSELFSESYHVDGAFLPNKEDPPQIRELRDLQGVEPDSISIEYISWKQTYFMLVKYVIKNKDGQVEHHLKILQMSGIYVDLIFFESSENPLVLQ